MLCVMRNVSSVRYLRPTSIIAVCASALAMLVAVPGAGAVTLGVGWSVTLATQPTRFQASDATDRYMVTVANVGSVASSGTVTLRDELPPGVTTSASPRDEIEASEEGVSWVCSPGAGQTVVTCTLSDPVVAQEFPKIVAIPVTVGNGASSPLENKVTVEGGTTATTPTGSTTGKTEISAALPSFGVAGFSFGAYATSGQSDTQAGDHPDALVASAQLTNILPPSINNNVIGNYVPVGFVKDILVDLPPGFTGDPLATGKDRCPLSKVTTNSLFETECPADTQVAVGTAVLTGFPLKFKIKIYNVTPEPGYPAEFGFNVQRRAVIMRATLGPAPFYRLQVAVPGVPTGVAFSEISIVVLR